MTYPAKTLTMVIGLLLMGSGVALAGKGSDKEAAGQSIYTPALQKDAEQTFTCRALNLGKSVEVVQISILSSQGKLLETQDAVKLEPGFTSSDSTTTNNSIAYCKVSVKNSPKDILVTLCSQATSKSGCQATVTGQYTSSN